MHSCSFCNKSFQEVKSLKSHRCKQMRSHTRNQLEANRENIIYDYTTNKHSVNELAIKYQVSYPKLLDYLNELGIKIESWTDPDRRQRRMAKTRATFLNKYGVDNAAKDPNVRKKVQQTCMDRYGVKNGSSSLVSQIKHYILGSDVEPDQKKEYQQYKSKIEQLTTRNKKELQFTGQCYYSGVEIHKTGPINDDFRASVDHRIPILVGFINKIPAQEIASVNNLVWCAKLLNTYKRAMTEEQFRSSGIIERFKQYEGQLRNPT